MRISGGIHRFQNEQNSILHPGRLQWPGTTDGYPVLGDNVNLRGQERDRLKLVSFRYSREFLLWHPDDKALFDAIMDRASVGWFRVLQRRERELELAGSCPLARAGIGLWVWLEWLQIYGTTAGADAALGGW